MSGIERDFPELSKWLSEESKKFTFAIELSNARRWATVEKIAGEVVTSIYGINADAQFVEQRPAFPNDVTIIPDELSLWDLPVAIQITFIDPDNYGIDSNTVGYINFSKAISSPDGLVDEPDQIELSLFLTLCVEKLFNNLEALPSLTLTVYGWRRDETNPSEQKVYRWNREEMRQCRIIHCHAYDRKFASSVESPVRQSVESPSEKRLLSIAKVLESISDDTKRISVGVGIVILMLLTLRACSP